MFVLPKLCIYCGAKRPRKNKFCTKECRRRFASDPKTITARFLSNVNSSSDANLCWPWTKSCDRDGYGVTTGFNRRYQGAHRVAWVIAYGLIPKGQCVCHKCDNPPCCNPTHLFLGTSAENSKDRDRKGRGIKGDVIPPEHRARGSRSGMAKLTEAQVVDLRLRHIAGESYVSLQQRFGVGKASVWYIVSRTTWRHI